MCCAVVLSERCVPLRYFYGTDSLFYHFAQFVWKRVLSLAQASHSGFDMCISCGGKKAFSVKNVTPFFEQNGAFDPRKTLFLERVVFQDCILEDNGSIK